MIKSYKGRKVNRNKSVRIYRTLTRAGTWYSIWQDGFVVAHTNSITLRNVTFKVSKAGYKRYLKQNRRNVHAFAIGYITNNRTWKNTLLPAKYSLDHGRFISKIGLFVTAISSAKIALFNGNGLSVINPTKL